MPNTKPPYPAKFKREAVRLVKESGRRISEVARDYGATGESFATGFGNMRVFYLLMEQEKANHSIVAMCRVSPPAASMPGVKGNRPSDL